MINRGEKTSKAHRMAPVALFIVEHGLPLKAVLHLND